MAGSVNRVTLLGNVGKDPELRSLQSGERVANFSLATSESWTDKASGEKREKTEWHRIVVFNDGLCGVVEKYVKKGSKVYVEGKIESRKWTDKEGREQTSVEIKLDRFDGKLVLLGDPGARDGGARAAETSRRTSGAPAADRGGAWSGGAAAATDLDDEIPF